MWANMEKFKSLTDLSFRDLLGLYTCYAGHVDLPVDMETFMLDLDKYWPSYQTTGQSARCCHANTLIPTSVGIIPISEIYSRFHNGEEIFALSDEGDKRVTEAINSGEISGIRYFATNGTRGVVGLDHKFKCINGRGFLHWKPAHTLRPGDKVVTVNQVHPAPEPIQNHSLETVDPLLVDLPRMRSMPKEAMLGDVNLKRCFIRRAFDTFEISRGPGISISFDYQVAAWEFFMLIVSIGVRPFVNDRTVVVLNGDVDNITQGCSTGSDFPYGPPHLNEFLRLCNGDLVSITFVDETRAVRYFD